MARDLGAEQLPRLDWTGRIYRHRKTSPKLLRATSSLVCFTGQRDPGSPLSPAPPGRPTDPRLARLLGRIPCFASLLLLQETEHLFLLELSSQKFVMIKHFTWCAFMLSKQQSTNFSHKLSQKDFNQGIYIIKSIVYSVNFIVVSLFIFSTFPIINPDF